MNTEFNPFAYICDRKTECQKKYLIEILRVLLRIFRRKRSLLTIRKEAMLYLRIFSE